MKTILTIADAPKVAAIAAQIGNCDFRTSISAYTSGYKPNQACRWNITVGESSWQRHLMVEGLSDDGTDAVLSILSPTHPGGIYVPMIDPALPDPPIITLKELIAGGYTGVKKILHPDVALAA